MIEAVILDVDGVIVGNTKGINFPQPSDIILQKMHDIRNKGIPVILCTGKFVYTILPIIFKAHLTNPHIADGGGIIIDPLGKNKIVEKYTLERTLAIEIIKTCLKNAIYVELYTTDTYYVQKNYLCEITKKHIAILEKEPELVDSIIDIAETNDLIKIMPVLKNEEEKKRLRHVIDHFANQSTVLWTIHPSALPSQYAVITAKGVSKGTTAKKVFEILHVLCENVLGIGDTTGDWDFMQHCGYVATLENATEKLKELVKTKGGKKHYIAPSVEDNGILHIFNYFFNEGTV
jgi:hydroxymethylpyrimidine pyrophosphatase-like HAD family hydrolase